MNKDQVKGRIEEVKGKAKEVTGKRAFNRDFLEFVSPGEIRNLLCH